MDHVPLDLTVGYRLDGKTSNYEKLALKDHNVPDHKKKSSLVIRGAN